MNTTTSGMAITELLDALEYCHHCKGQIALDEPLVTRCESCSYDCEDHEPPECTPIYVLHMRARNAVADLEHQLTVAREALTELFALAKYQSILTAHHEQRLTKALAQLDAGKEIAEKDCPDCQAAKRHAYSDATTPGFFFTQCDKHRAQE